MEEPFSPTFFRRLQQLKIRTRRAFLGSRQGAHRSIRKGHGLEFHDFRPYSPGDDFRHIDWGVYGRTDRLYVREFREEQDLNVVLLLDASASMAYPEGEKKFEVARDIALALGYIALTDGDSVTFSALGQKNTPRYSGPRALRRAYKQLAELKPEGQIDILTEVRAAIAAQKIPGKCFFISDFLFESETQIAALDYLRAKNFEISVIQILAPSELTLNPNQSPVVVDSETGARIELSLDSRSVREHEIQLAQHMDKLEDYCARSAISYALVSSSESISEAVLTRFPQLGILK